MLLFSFFSVQCSPWALYCIIQADGYLQEPAQTMLRTIEKTVKKAPPGQIFIIVDLVKGTQFFRYSFSKEGKALVETGMVNQLKKILKKGLFYAFKGRSGYRTMVIYSGHGSGVEKPHALPAPLWEQIKLDSYLYNYRKKRSLFFADLVDAKRETPILPLKGIVDTEIQGLITVELMRSCLEWVSKNCLDRKKIDIIGFDACQMALFEHAYDLATVGRYLVASQEKEYKNGWDYEALLESLSYQRGPRWVGRRLVYAYELQQRKLGGIPYSLSLVDLQTMDELKTAFVHFALVSSKQVKHSLAFCEIMAEVRIRLRQRSGDSHYIDLVAYGEELLEELLSIGRDESLEKLYKALERLLFLTRVAVDATVSSTLLKGCSLYFPFTYYRSCYNGSSPVINYWSDLLEAFNDRKLE